MNIYEAYVGKQERNTPSGLFTEDTAPKKIVLRAEQREAVDKAKSQFGKNAKKNEPFVAKPNSQQFLWNAKMRFGKTFCALQLAKEMNLPRVLIVTHRPVVNEQWHEEFKTIFHDVLYRWGFGTKFDDDDEGNFYSLEKSVEDEGKGYLFFASMQYLRRSTLVGGDNDEQLKKDILQTDWDMVVIDEAHEGTRTMLGKSVIDLLQKENTKMLHLSGTPFNLYSDFKPNEIFTWDYIQEQQTKRNWAEKHKDKPNPYEDLPEMKIFTYDLNKLFKHFEENGANFSFSEFFRTWTGNIKADKEEMPEGAKGKFVHEEDVTQFLDKLTANDEESNYPFSTKAYKKNFRHTLWVVPGVKEAKALTDLLKQHKTFRRFNIVNVAGNNSGDEERDNALDRVKAAIGDHPEGTRSITISCGRLTTGVTVKPWTAVFYLKGSEMTSAATYMQTIFRVQSPHEITTEDGEKRIKKECYVFDFSADRTLRMVAETAKYSSFARQTKKKKDDVQLTQEEKDKEIMSEWLKFCPICSLDGGKMSSYNVNDVFRQLEKAYVERLVLSGFNDNSLYDTEELLKMDSKTLNDLGNKIALSTNMEKPKKASNNDFSMSHLTEEERRRLEEAKRKEKENSKNGKNKDAGKTPEELAAEAKLREKKKKEREEREKRISNIRGIALRIPLMMYGGSEAGDPTEPLTVENFTRKIKDESWEEFMPRGVTKQDFNYVRRVFNATRFEEAGKRYRQLAREADFMHTEERIQRIADIFACFHNPDKETVLTPWRVVNMHMSDTLGGYSFFNEKFDGPNLREIRDEVSGEVVDLVPTDEPRFVDQGAVTQEVFGSSESRVLEINSKTGLYPLYITYTLYRHRMHDFEKANLIEESSVEEEQVVWDDVVKNNVYVICNTSMAESITRRTLMGFRDVSNDNIKTEKLVDKAIEDTDELAKSISKLGFWKGNRSKEDMKFNAVVGNPPYQVMDHGAGASAKPIYQHFVNVAKQISPKYISLIMPARWYAGGKGLDSFRREMLNDHSISHLYDFKNAKECFPSAEIAGGICYFLIDKGYDGVCTLVNSYKEHRTTEKRFLNEHQVLVRDNIAIYIIAKIKKKDNIFLSESVRSRNYFSLPSTERGNSHKEPKDLNLLSSGGRSYISREKCIDRDNIISKYKVIVTYAMSGGNKPSNNGQYQILSSLMVLYPDTVCTETYLIIDEFDTISEAKGLESYLSTKFVRYLLLQALTSIHITKSSFIFVPGQDFTSKSEINWLAPIAEIDKQLYAKYQLSDLEISTIESTIKSIM